MITEKPKIPIKTSNPVAAFKQLEGKSFHVHATHEHAFPSQHPTIVQKIDSVLKRAETSSHTSASDLHLQPSSPSSNLTDQNQQLLDHLKDKERILAEQDADHHVRVWNWQQEVAQTQTRQSKRHADLDQQEEQLRALQFELFQLQNQLIDSQLATREIVNDLSLPGQQVHALNSLKLELNQRFDHMMITWRAFADEMQELAVSITDQVDPGKSL